MITQQDLKFMEMALEQAALAYSLGEVPVGAVIVKDSAIIAAAHNTRERDAQATHHAEILAIEQACQALGSWRLDGCRLYVTLEPCPMCAGAIINARISDVYFGAFDQKAGSVGSVINLFALDYPFRPRIHPQVLEGPCGEILCRFFESLRI